METDPAATPSIPARTHIVLPQEGRVIRAFGDTVQVKLDAAQTGGAMTVVLNTVPPRHGPPPHVHHAEDETFLVVEGTFEFMQPDGEWSAAMGPGGAAYTPRGVRHCFRNAGDAPARAWIIASPSGFETFFTRCAEVFAAGSAGGPPDMARILAISGEHGIEYVPPLDGSGAPATELPPGN